MNKVFVGSLAWVTDDDSLRKAFQEQGEIVDARVMHDRDTGRSRGFGFVTFAFREEAVQALSMNGANLDGRHIRVLPAKPKIQRDYVV